MPRAKEKAILTSSTKNWQTHEVVIKKKLFVIVYKGSVVSVRQTSMLKNSGPHYSKMTFYTRACAQNQVDKMNELFNTTEFSIRELSLD